MFLSVARCLGENKQTHPISTQVKNSSLMVVTPLSIIIAAMRIDLCLQKKGLMKLDWAEDSARQSDNLSLHDSEDEWLNSDAYQKPIYLSVSPFGCLIGLYSINFNWIVTGQPLEFY